MSNLKVMLTYPNVKWTKWDSATSWTFHPYNLGLLASMIRDKYDVEIFDSTMEDVSREDFGKTIAEKKPDVLGISVLVNEYGEIANIAAKIAKEAYPAIKIVAGGVHAMSSPSRLVADTNIDYVVRGEGEYAFRDLCSFLNGNGKIPERGVTYRKDGQLIDGGVTAFVQNLDRIPFPAYDLVDFKKYTMKTQRESVDSPREPPFTGMRTSRGCPYTCCFCEIDSIAGRKTRFRSLENVASEIEWLIHDYGIKSLAFYDDNLIVDPKRAKDLFRMMAERKYNLKWNNPGTALYKIDEEMMDLMKKSGCVGLNVAIESGNERVLRDIVHKPLNLEFAKKTLKMMKKYDIFLAANFVVGFPGETWDEIRQTIKFAEEIDVDYVKIYNATPFPNTALYNVAKEQDLFREGFDDNKLLWREGWLKSSEFRPQDLKILRAYEWDRINFSNPEKRKKIANVMGITEERLNEIRKETLEKANP